MSGLTGAFANSFIGGFFFSEGVILGLKASWKFKNALVGQENFKERKEYYNLYQSLGEKGYLLKILVGKDSLQERTQEVSRGILLGFYSFLSFEISQYFVSDDFLNSDQKQGDRFNSDWTALLNPSCKINEGNFIPFTKPTSEVEALALQVLNPFLHSDKIDKNAALQRLEKATLLNKDLRIGCRPAQKIVEAILSSPQTLSFDLDTNNKLVKSLLLTLHPDKLQTSQKGPLPCQSRLCKTLEAPEFYNQSSKILTGLIDTFRSMKKDPAKSRNTHNHQQFEDLFAYAEDLLKKNS